MINQADLHGAPQVISFGKTFCSLIPHNSLGASNALHHYYLDAYDAVQYINAL